MKPFNEHGTKKANFKKHGQEGLHGDVILTLGKKPKGFDDMPVIEDDCLAYGEATGHAHKIFGEPGSFSVRECKDTKTRHLHVVSEVMLKHQEHSPAIIPAGFYRIGIQREYDPFTKLIRQVID